ncbi:hypothetical protein U1Q18_029491 [Sarracenia purpurea var. burkii]
MVEINIAASSGITPLLEMFCAASPYNRCFSSSNLDGNFLITTTKSWSFYAMDFASCSMFMLLCSGSGMGQGTILRDGPICFIAAISGILFLVYAAAFWFWSVFKMLYRCN